MPHPYFDYDGFRFEGVGQTFYDKLCASVPRQKGIEDLFLATWESLASFPTFHPFSAVAVWKEVLIMTGMGRRLPRFFDAIRKDPGLIDLHEPMKAIQDAQDPVHATRLGTDKYFLDRTLLRSALDNMSPDKSVLVVRGDRDTGKSWTRELIKASFYPPDAFVENNSVVNYSFSDFILRLTKKLDPKATLEDSLTTDSASNRQIIIGLLALAEGRNAQDRKRTWIIVDDLNELDDADPDRSRLSDCERIRSFMDSFVIEMEDSTAFGEHFRLVLIDYPDKDLTRWPDVWIEDRPEPSLLDAPVISAFLVGALKERDKFLDPAEADKRAAEILKEAAAHPPRGRIRKIMEAIRAQVAALAALAP